MKNIEHYYMNYKLNLKKDQRYNIKLNKIQYLEQYNWQHTASIQFQCNRILLCSFTVTTAHRY